MRLLFAFQDDELSRAGEGVPFVRGGGVYRFPFAIPGLQNTCLSSACLSLFAIHDAEFLRAGGRWCRWGIPFSPTHPPPHTHTHTHTSAPTHFSPHPLQRPSQFTPIPMHRCTSVLDRLLPYQLR